MRPITIKKDQQPDGSIHHVATVGCPLSPCAIVRLQGEVPDACDCLHSNGVDDDGNIRWCCNKLPCRSGV